MSFVAICSGGVSQMCLHSICSAKTASRILPKQIKLIYFAWSLNFSSLCFFYTFPEMMSVHTMEADTELDYETFAPWPKAHLNLQSEDCQPAEPETVEQKNWMDLLVCFSGHCIVIAETFRSNRAIRFKEPT
jgi:hypothetical protein